MFSALVKLWKALVAKPPAKPRKRKVKPDIQLPAEYAVPDRDEMGHPYMILKDVHEDGHGNRSLIEVRSDGIEVQTHGKTTQIALNSLGAALAQIDEDIRLQITRKISLLVPTLADSKKELLVRHVFRALFLLAQDQLPRVRQMIAEELRDSYNAPAELAQRLAWDDELAVSAPILEFSPLLNDQDLIEIISQAEIPGVLEAIAKRQKVAPNVSEAIVKNVSESRVRHEDVRIITNLLENKGAEFHENTLEQIIDEAENHEIWHASLLARPEMTQRMINKVARFVSSALILEMKEQGLVEPAVGKNLSHAVASRLQSPQVEREREADKAVVDQFTHGTLNAEAILLALDEGKREYVISGLALLAELPKVTTQKIIKAQDPKAVTALVWKAKLPVRVSMPVQLKVAKIPFTRILYPKEGERFPISETEMQRLLDKYSNMPF